MNPEILAFAIIVILFSVIVHEVMHGVVALFFGDHTAENAGRLTLNPIPHIDPIGTVLLPLIFILIPLLTGTPLGFFIAWAKPVPVNPLNFNNIRKGELFVSLAGIASNLALAILGAILFHIFSNSSFATIFQIMVNINLMLAIFNLLPIPPLDGYNALISYLPFSIAKSYQRLYPYGFFIILALLYLGVIGLILNLVLLPLLGLLGIPPL